jgi:hypothetical protein
VPMGVVSIGVVPMGVLSLGAVGMGLINACVVGMGVIHGRRQRDGVVDPQPTARPRASAQGGGEQSHRLPQLGCGPGESGTAGLPGSAPHGGAVDALR